MPQVGAQEFPYTPAGIADAKRTARATGQQVRARRGYRDVAKQQHARARKHKKAATTRVVDPNGIPNDGDEYTVPVGGKGKGKGKGGTSIAAAIKRPGALTAAVGGKPSQNMGKVNKLAQSGTTRQKREALFFKNVLAKAGH